LGDTYSKLIELREELEMTNEFVPMSNLEDDAQALEMLDALYYNDDAELYATSIDDFGGPDDFACVDGDSNGNWNN
jgi:hypothetical protein